MLHKVLAATCSGGHIYRASLLEHQPAKHACILLTQLQRETEHLEMLLSAIIQPDCAA